MSIINGEASNSMYYTHIIRILRVSSFIISSLRRIKFSKFVGELKQFPVLFQKYEDIFYFEICLPSKTWTQLDIISLTFQTPCRLRDILLRIYENFLRNWENKLQCSHLITEYEVAKAEVDQYER